MPPTRSVTLRILGDDLSARAAVNWVNAGADDIDRRRPTLKIGADIKQAEGPLAGLRASVAALTDKFETIKFDANDTRFNATLAGMTAKLAAFQALADRPILSNKQLVDAKAGVLNLAASFDELMAKQEAARAATIQPKEGGFEAPGWFGTFTNFRAPLFGGLAKTTGLHVIADSLLELTAVAVPATIAIAAFGAALIATAPDLEIMYTRERAMFIASQALQQSMPGLSGNFKKLADDIKPQTFAVWGDVLTILNNNTGTFATLAHEAVNWVDKFAARMAVDLTSGSGGFMKLIEVGKKDLAGLGTVFSGLGNIFMTFIHITQTTHIAEDLLAILGVLVKIAAAVVSFPPVTALLTLGIALHGIYLWGGLAVSGVSKLFEVLAKVPGLGVLKPLGDLPGVFEGIAKKGLDAATGLDFTVKGFKGVATDAEGAAVKSGFFKTSLAALSQVPIWGWIAVGTIAVAAIGLAFLKTKSAADEFNDSINKSILRASNQTVFNTMVDGIDKVNQQLAKTPTASAAASAAMHNAGMSGKNAYDNIAGAARQASATQQDYRDETKKVTTQLQNFGSGVSWIMKTFGVDYPTALAIADKANVKLVDGITGSSHAAKVARQEIIGLMQGFEQLSTPAGRVGQDFSVLAYQGAQVTKNIQQVNSAWQQWMGTVTGGETAFDTFAQGMNILNDSGAKFRVNLGQLIVKGTQSKAAIDDLSLAGLNLNAAFQQEVGNANSLIGALRTQGATNEQVTKTTKAAVAALIPFAKGSTEATSVLYGLAKQADYTGDNSIKALTAWAGIKAPEAMKILKRTTDDSTKAASDLAKTLQNILNVQFQQDIIKSSGASRALQKYTDDLVHNRQTTRAGQTDRQHLINDLISAGMKANDAAKFVNNLSTQLHRVPKNTFIQVREKGTGLFTITGPGILASQGPGGSGNAAGGLASGGRIPGYGGGDRWPALLEGGEAVVPKHLVAPIAPFLAHHRVPGFAAGGLAGGGSFDGSIAGLPAFTARMHNTFVSDMTKAMETSIKNGLQNAIGLLGPTGGSGVTRWAPVILAALQLLGQPASLLGAVEYRMNIESGGNPLAVNNWDSNAAAGMPSTGLMQVIRPTYQAYAGPFRNVGPFLNGVSVAPLANIYAGLNYALHAYSSIAAAMLKSGGYANGGVITEPMFAIGASGRGLWLGERGPEVVTPLSRGHFSGGIGGGHQVTYIINVQPTPLAQPKDIGREVVKAIRAFERGSGKSWRS